MQEFSCRGRWWLARSDDVQETDHSVFGRLTFSREHGLVLETRLNLEREDSSGLHSLILGVVTEGGLDQGAITLQSCQRDFDPALGQDVRQYRVEVAYFGQHFATQEQIGFQRFVVKVDHLAAWVDAQGLAAEIERDVHGSITSYILKDSYGLADKVAVVGDNQIKINAGVDHSSKMTGNTRQFTYRHESSLEVSTATPITVHDVLSRFIYPIADLATIATSQPQSVESIMTYYDGDQLNGHELFEAEHEARQKAQGEEAGQLDEQTDWEVEDKDRANEEPDQRRPRQVRIAYKVPDYSKVAVPANRSVLFTLRQPQVQANFEQMLGCWLTSDQNVKRGLELVYGPVLRLYYAPQTSSLLRFFSLVQAAEGYHRLRYTNADLAIESNYKPSDLLSQTRASGDLWTTDQHKAFRNDLIAAASESYGGWLASALHEEMSNEPNLVTRLEHLLITIAEVGEDKRLQGVTRASTRVVDEATSALIFNRGTFSQVVARTRNDFAHLLEAGEQREAAAVESAATEAEAVELEQKAFNKRAAEGEELEYINDVLQYLIRSYMLYELGFDVQQRSEMIAQDPYYSTTMRRSAAIKDWIKNKQGEFRQRTKKAKKGPDESKEQATQKDSPLSREQIAAHFGLPSTATGEVYGYLKKLVKQGVLAGNDHARAEELAHEFIQSNPKLKKLLGTAAHGDGGGRELS